ncbi:hypothetical protein, partial [Neisseria sicca]|uniref:hypothetical protein n=1 Tax=Neisseria sicca TaxID=490 RepID=UPI001C9A1931
EEVVLKWGGLCFEGGFFVGGLFVGMWRGLLKGFFELGSLMEVGGFGFLGENGGNKLGVGEFLWELWGMVDLFVLRGEGGNLWVNEGGVDGLLVEGN